MRFLASTTTITSTLSKHSIKATALSGMAVQVTRSLASFATLPLLLGKLGQAGLGVWIIALSLMGLVATLNGGLSISLVTLIGRENTNTGLRRLTTAATVIALFTSAFVLLLTLPAALMLDWESLLNLRTTLSGDEVSWMMLVLAVLVSLGMIASVPRQVILGRMQGYFSNILDIIGLIIGTTGLIISLFLGSPLWLLALVFVGTPTFIGIFGGLAYMRQAGIPMFSKSSLDRRTLDNLFRDSIKMAAYHGAYSISSQSDLILIGVILGAPAGAVYGVAQRIFSLLVMLGLTVNLAQWPALARADAVGDAAVLRRMFRKTLLIVSGVATVAAIAVATAYQPLLELWLGHRLETNPALLMGMVAWVLVATLVNTFDSVLRAKNETSLLMQAMISMALINVTTTIVLLNLIGTAGAIWGSVIGYTFALLIPYTICLKEHLIQPARPSEQMADNG